MTEQEWILKLERSIPKEILQVVINYQHKTPVDIFGICEELKLPVYETYMHTKIDGWIEYTNNNFEIYINPQYPAKRKRYTLAHELSHFLLHKDKIIENGNLDRGYKASGGFNLIEWQANLYASELLIPTELVKIDIYKLAALNEYSISEYLDILSEKIVEKYKVSTAVAIKRARRALKAVFDE